MMENVNMTKIYMVPEMEIVEVKPIQLLIVSGEGVNGNGMPYGGVDEEGNLEPAAPPSLELPF